MDSVLQFRGSVMHESPARSTPSSVINKASPVSLKTTSPVTISVENASKVIKRRQSLSSDRRQTLPPNFKPSSGDGDDASISRGKFISLSYSFTLTCFFIRWL